MSALAGTLPRTYNRESVDQRPLGELLDLFNSAQFTGHGATKARDLHPDIEADYVLANPPFNIKDWARRDDDARWRYGVPPAGNANHAWIQLPVWIDLAKTDPRCLELNRASTAISP